MYRRCRRHLRLCCTLFRSRIRFRRCRICMCTIMAWWRSEAPTNFSALSCLWLSRPSCLHRIKSSRSGSEACALEGNWPPAADNDAEGDGTVETQDVGGHGHRDKIVVTQTRQQEQSGGGA